MSPATPRYPAPKGSASSALLTTIAVLFLLAAGSFGVYVAVRPRPLPDQLLYGNGRIEGIEVRVAPQWGGRVIESRLIEGSTVEAGTTLLRIDDTEIRLERDRAVAEIGAIESEAAAVRAEQEVARRHRETAERDLERGRSLFESGTMTERELDALVYAASEARGHLAVTEAQSQLLDSRMAAARGGLAIIEDRIEKTPVIAPRSGTVILKAIEPGEFIAAGQTAAVLVDLTQLELKVFISEIDIGRITLGSPARIRVDAFPDRLFDARVIRIDQQAQFTPRDVHMPDERTRLVFGITLQVQNPAGLLKPGQPADAWILWNPEADWPTELFPPQ